MRNSFIVATTALGMMAATPISAQNTVTATETIRTPDGVMTSTVFSISPRTGLSDAEYVQMTADALNYEEQAARLAATRSGRAEVKGYAKGAARDSRAGRASLMTALSNDDRKIARPSSTLSSARKADIDLLRKAPRQSFDTLYLTQSAKAKEDLWSLQQGYSRDGDDRALRQISENMGSMLQRDYLAIRTLAPAG